MQAVPATATAFSLAIKSCRYPCHRTRRTLFESQPLNQRRHRFWMYKRTARRGAGHLLTPVEGGLHCPQAWSPYLYARTPRPLWESQSQPFDAGWSRCLVLRQCPPSSTNTARFRQLGLEIPVAEESRPPAQPESWAARRIPLERGRVHMPRDSGWVSPGCARRDGGRHAR